MQCVNRITYLLAVIQTLIIAFFWQAPTIFYRIYSAKNICFFMLICATILAYVKYKLAISRRYDHTNIDIINLMVHYIVILSSFAFIYMNIYSSETNMGKNSSFSGSALMVEKKETSQNQIKYNNLLEWRKTLEQNSEESVWSYDELKKVDLAFNEFNRLKDNAKESDSIYMIFAMNEGRTDEMGYEITFNLLPDSQSFSREDGNIIGLYLSRVNQNTLDYLVKRNELRNKDIQDNINILNEHQRYLSAYLKHELSYWDFLYFSAIITGTVGFGDIVPNTTETKLYVTLQICINIFVTFVLLNVIIINSSNPRPPRLAKSNAVRRNSGTPRIAANE